MRPTWCTISPQPSLNAELAIATSKLRKKEKWKNTDSFRTAVRKREFSDHDAHGISRDSLHMNEAAQQMAEIARGWFVYPAALWTHSESHNHTRPARRARLPHGGHLDNVDAAPHAGHVVLNTATTNIAWLHFLYGSFLAGAFFGGK